MKVVMSIFLLVWSNLAFSEVRVRSTEWAVPIIGTSLENAFKVDEGVYRSEQPNKTEFKELSKFGLKEVLNLREFHSDDDEAEKTDIRLHRIKVDTGAISQQQIIEALKIIQARKGPILIHCWHGSDRTGAVIASYRVVFNNWSKEKAIDELRHGGFGYHASIYPNVVELIDALDVKKIKAELGIIKSKSTKVSDNNNY